MADESRIRSFKNKGKDCEEMRRRRVGQTIELRKAKKEDQLLKRRNICVTEEGNDASLEQVAGSPISLTTEQILWGMMSADEGLQLQAVQACRKILSRERNPPIDQMIRLGVVPRCVEFLGQAHNPSLQYEACWALTNIASGTSDQTAAVIQEGAIQKFQRLLFSDRDEIVEQTVWAIGNIAGDGPDARDRVLAVGILNDLLSLVKPSMSLSLLKNIVWVISNLCRNKNPYPNFEAVRPALPYLAKLLTHSDKDVLADSCWALSYLTDGSNEKIQAVLDAGLIQNLALLLYNEECTVLTPALRAIGNIVTGNDQQTDMAINAGILNVLPRLLQHSRLNIVKEAAWTVSNITAGNQEQIQKVVDAGLLPLVLHVLQTGDFKSQKEAAWAVTNFTSGGTPVQLAKLVEMGALKPMCNLLNSKDTKTIIVILDGLNNILAMAAKLGQAEKVAIMIEECGGLDGIEALQGHDNEKVYEKALEIIENYFSEGDEGLEPPAVSNGEIQFSAPSEVPDSTFTF